MRARPGYPAADGAAPRARRRRPRTGMPAGAPVAGFLAGAAVSLAASWILASRLERAGGRLGLSAALAADAHEVTAAITAMAGHQRRPGARVVIGSNVFNQSAPGAVIAGRIRLSAVIAGRIRLHRMVVILPGRWRSAGPPRAWPWCSACRRPPAWRWLVPSSRCTRRRRAQPGGARGVFPIPPASVTRLGSAAAEEELELDPAIRPQWGRRQDMITAAGSLLDPQRLISHRPDAGRGTCRGRQAASRSPSRDPMLRHAEPRPVTLGRWDRVSLVAPRRRNGPDMVPARASAS